MNRNRFLRIVIFLSLFLFGLYCYMKDYGYADENKHLFEYSVPVEKEYLFQHYDCRSNWQAKPGRGSVVPSYNQKQMWQEAYDNHHFNAVRTYNDAYNRVWYLPDFTWRQIGRDAWVAACATAGASTPTGALVIVVTTMLSSHGLRCLDEWDYIQEKLRWSQYHFDECARYAQLLKS